MYIQIHKTYIISENNCVFYKVKNGSSMPKHVPNSEHIMCKSLGHLPFGRGTELDTYHFYTTRTVPHCTPCASHHTELHPRPSGSN